MMNQKFRYDINGLRAYAVAFVVLFHFGILGFNGGFVGVDIFFVISGFLMTKIIASGIENNSFSFLKFYLSRANRIIPALVALCLTIALVGWFTLTPQEYKDFGKHAATSLSFISNIQYFRESGYFDAVSHEKLLLHTWSLSVEWQFYILLPIFLYFINKAFKSKNALTISFCLLLAISFSLSIIVSKINPSAAFYLLPTRAWEMMAGGLIYLFFNKTSFSKRTSLTIELSGFALIFASVVFFSTTTLWPSYNAVVPVIGTFLVLLAANNSSVFTNNIIAQFLGNTSYSIYLWHWPLVFYLGYLEVSHQPTFVLAAIVLSVVFGWASYKYIETPTRKWLSNRSTKAAYGATALYVSIPTVMLASIFAFNGYKDRLPENIQLITNETEDRNPRMKECHLESGDKLPECRYGKGKVSLIVLGDSHGAAMIRSIEKAAPKGTSVLDWTYSGCPTVEGIKKINSPDYKCGEVISNLITKAKNEYPNTPIVIINRLNVLFHGAPEETNTPIRYITKPYKAYSKEYAQEMHTKYVDTVCKFRGERKLFIISSVPEYTIEIPKVLAHRSIMRNSAPITQTYTDFQERSKLSNAAQVEAAKRCGAEIIDITSAFCDSDKCVTTKDGKPLYFDDDHLSVFGADQLIPKFKTMF
ncbi:acyltransferase family protein [Acinetobacter baumannii]|uniref:acyltransferase family protein n=1 Tax=Acinetobacter baumannii TaxID=470 RepID=UPI00044D8BDE|nr:acyltransferase family protein [Acinetobacter baumannii]EXD15032.1 acyltransferase family protein [Acinetobacter baumannii 1297]